MNNLYGGDANDHSWNIPDAEQADADWVQTIPDSEYVALLEGKPCGQGENRKYGANLAGECARLQHEIPEENARADRQVARNGLTVHHTREILRNLGYGNEGELDEELVQAGHRARRAAFSMLGRPFDTDALAAVSVFHSEHSRDENLAHYAFNARCLVSDNIETATKLATCVPLVAAEKYKEPVTSLMCISIAEIADLEAIRAIEQQHAEEMQQAELLLDLNETLNANEPVEQATETQVEGGKTPTAQQQPEVPAIEINDNDIYAFIASGVGVPEPEAFDPHALLKGQILKENDIADWQVKTGMPQVAYAEEILRDLGYEGELSDELLARAQSGRRSAYAIYGHSFDTDDKSVIEYFRQNTDPEVSLKRKAYEAYCAIGDDTAKMQKVEACLPIIAETDEDSRLVKSIICLTLQQIADWDETTSTKRFEEEMAAFNEGAKDDLAARLLEWRPPETNSK